MPAKTGGKMYFYRNTGTVASPVWELIDEIGDLNISDLSMGLAELKRRANGYTKNLTTLMQSISVEFRLHYGLDTDIFDDLRANFFAGTAEEFAILDGLVATTGTQGLRCPFVIEQFPWSQGLEEVSGFDVRLAIAYMVASGSEVEPSWMTVTP